ncbi:TIGR03086 family protein [Solihabitans fulvus]|uniref:TIGR03086 family protein n=1 Tax=Solihabitans fulvus TaxID=1892852 RepID=A0A5B2XFU9_9PSEU|nr:TIGR03086 family metal-binding protein [Solihabitans fulvus]KAA2262213.1 TIGR03086 family protein [Solihabitans fulvus]
MDYRELDRRAVEASRAVVATVTVDQLELPTPCAAWNLRELLVHLIDQHRGFAAAARGNGADLSAWRGAELGDDPVAAYDRAADEVLAAFAEVDDLDRMFELPEFGQPFPAKYAIGFHFIDYVVHAWDVARTVGIPHGIDEDLAVAAWPIADRVPTELRPGQEKRAFERALPAVADAAPMDRLLARLGRNPAWAP